MFNKIVTGWSLQPGVLRATCGGMVRAIAVAAVLVLALGGYAMSEGSAGIDRQPAPSYYLALGDSVPVWNGPQSYPDLILAHYERELPNLSLEDIAVSGETTSSMLQSQYPAALSFLRAHTGHISLITIDIGGNDIVGCALSVDTTAPYSPCSVQARATIKRNLTTILAGLHAAAPEVPVIGMSYYDPLLGDWLAPGPPRALALATLPGLVILNRELTSLYGGPSKTANVQGIFRSTDLETIVPSPWGAIPLDVERACSWLDIFCQAGAPEGFGDDPNNAGAVAIATAFERRIDRLCVARRSGTFRRCGARARQTGRGGAGAGQLRPPAPAATTCGIPYTFRFDRTTVTAGSCARILPLVPSRFAIRLGQRFSVEVAHEMTGALDFPVPSPEGSAVRLLSQRGAKAIYVARSPGTATLLARHTRLCESSDPAFGSCAVLVVRVIRPRATGALTGAILFVGGPYTPHRPPVAGDVSVFASASVHIGRERGVWLITGREVADQHVDAGHYFRFRLPPGRYDLELSGGSDCRPAGAVVRAGRTTHVDVDVGCGIP